MQQLRSRLTYANVMATVAVFIALGGGAWALSRGEVKSKHIAKGAVKKSDLARGAVEKRKVARDSVNTRKVADGSLLGVDFAAGELPQGERGPQGEPGDKGERGDVGPTEGIASPPVASPGGLTLEEEGFETTLEGRLLATKSVTRVNVNCDSGNTFSVWLEIDGVPVPGSEIAALPEDIDLYGLTFTGVTADSVPAGQHTASTVFECTEAFSGNSSSVTTTTGVSAVVLGG